MRCPECGHRIKSSHYVCPNCGVYTNLDEIKRPNIIVCLISVLIPPLGCLFFLINDNATPKRAKTYLYCTLFGIICYVLIVFGIKRIIQGYINEIADGWIKKMLEVLEQNFNR